MGDCYFLAALAAIAQNPEHVESLFPHRLHRDGKWTIRLCKNGQWQEVEVDDNFPQHEDHRHRTVFARSHGRELWVMLLEKASASTAKYFVTRFVVLVCSSTDLLLYNYILQHYTLMWGKIVYNVLTEPHSTFLSCWVCGYAGVGQGDIETHKLTPVS